MKVSRRTYRLLHFLLFALPLACATLIMISELRKELLAQLAALGALVCAVLAAADFVRVWRETEPKG